MAEGGAAQSRKEFKAGKGHLSVLRCLAGMGRVLDFGGRDGSRSELRAVRDLSSAGMVSGSERCASFTEAGRAFARRMGIEGRHLS